MSTEFNELYKILYELSKKNQKLPESPKSPIKTTETCDIIVNYNPIPPKQRKKICKTLQCAACLKSFALQKTLDNHYEQNNICKNWIPSTPVAISIYDHITHILQKCITGEHPYQCKFCKHIFTNQLLHYQHYEHVPVCNYYAHIEFNKNK
jgi:hypothetical protein